jgi:XkdW protein
MRLDAWKAFKHLFPDASPITDYRLTANGDGAELTEWGLGVPEPSAAEIDQAILDYDAAEAAKKQTEAEEETAITTTRNRIRTTAQSAVGVAFDQLTAAQLRSLVAILLWGEKALDRNGVIRPLAEWVRLDD